MKQYAVFVGDRFYPSGGMKDFAAEFESYSEAMAYVNGAVREWGKWAQVADMSEGKILYETQSERA